MILEFIREHKLAFCAAFAVGLIYILPHVFFIAADRYQGIPMMQTANEDEYLLRIREIMDGHWTLGSPVFYEYKDQLPLSPPVGEFFYAMPAMLFRISPVNVLIASRFYFPFMLFFLVYFLIWKLTGQSPAAAGKINAAAGALFVTLGYDLVDFRSIFGFIAGKSVLGRDFLIWSRPVNPILGAIFLFSFLILIWAIVKNTNWPKLSIIFAGLFLALMMGSYFFSWGTALSVAGVLVLIYLFKKEYRIAKNLIFIVFLGFLFALPYWYGALKAAASPWHQESVLRSGLFLTHYPLFNKLLLAVLGFYAALFFRFKDEFREKMSLRFADWHWFSLAFIFGGLLVYSQQIVTGRAVWPYHFVQYTIPLAMAVFMVLTYRIFYEKNRYVWLAAILAVAISSLTFGLYVQFTAYAENYGRYAELQNYASPFDWLNRQEKDCVALALDENDDFANFDHAVPAFTRCNLYNSTWVFSLMPEERIFHNYFTRLFLNGVNAENIENYLAGHRQEARGRLFTNWKGPFGVKDFPDFSDQELETRFEELARDYRDFLKRDFVWQLQKYKLDYIFVHGGISDQAAGLIKDLKPVYNDGEFEIYKF